MSMGAERPPHAIQPKVHVEKAKVIQMILHLFE